MKIRCSTHFDISATGVTGHYRPARVPFNDRCGQRIDNEQSWNLARNQQRNWETVTQVMSLRTQIENVTDPQRAGDIWWFECEIANDQLYQAHDDEFFLLKFDCENVPMLINLTESCQDHRILIPNKNIWFEQVSVNIE